MKSECVRQQWWRQLSPATALMFIAALLALTFAFVAIAGWRDHTTFLSLTPSATGETSDRSIVQGAAYISSFLLVTIVVPVLFLAAGFCALFKRLGILEAAPKRSRATAPDHSLPSSSLKP